ncbi:MAG: hypothetical protein HY836_05755 [Aquabacterium sp.]|uniref:hypothetical protein n=1 Tax=Aquabacterium sp. TaxID=1872578 RepID=UPI0025BC7F54|nr:hypothetical protein [Aquabacterium sp.]MBI5925087.1 hypothetical protein [Aquabacterium sp.]
MKIGPTWLGCTMLVAALLLSACGAGDGRDDNQASPNSLAANPANAAYQVALAYATPLDDPWRGDQPQEIKVISPQTGQVVWSLASETLSVALSTSMTVNADGVPISQGPAQRLFYIDQGVVQTLSLQGDTTPRPRQLSQTSAACRIERVINSDTSGDVAWLLVSLPGANGQCDGMNASDTDDVPVLIGSWQTASEPPVRIDFYPHWMLGPRYTPQGQLTGLLLSTPSGITFIQADGGRRSIDDPSLFGARLLGQVPGKVDQAYVKIEQAIHVLDWSDGRIALSTAPAARLTNTNPSAPRVAWAHETGLYFIVDGRLWQLDGQHRAQAVATPPDLDESRLGDDVAVSTPQELLFVQDVPGSPGKTQVRALSRTTGAAYTLFESVQANQPDPIVLTLGRVALILQAEDMSETRWTIARADLSSQQTAQVVARGVSILHALLTSQTHGGMTHMVWCQANAGAQCPVASLVSYNVEQNLARPLATSQLAREQGVWSILNISQIEHTGAPVFTSYTPLQGGGHQRRTWQFNPDGQGSLKLVQDLPR